MSRSPRAALAPLVLVMFALFAASAQAEPGSEPTISGTPIDGQTLSASEGSWAELSSELTFTYQWSRCNADQVYDCTEISGAIGSTLLLTPNEVGYKIIVVVTADNGEATTSQTSAHTGPVNALAPASEGTPTITGQLVNGSTVTADPGPWAGTPEITFEYQWYRCNSDGAACLAIHGATGSTHELSHAEVGGTLMYGIAGANQGGVTGVFSAVSGIVANMPRPTVDSYPVVTGEAIEGSTLATTTGTWTSSGPIIYSFEWLRCDSAGSNCDGIPGAIDQTYVITAQDLGYTVTARVHAINGGGSTGATALPPLGPVVGPPDPLPEPPTGPPIDLTPGRLSLEVRTPSQTMERAEFEVSLPKAGHGIVTGTVVDDTRHRGPEHARRTPKGKPYTAFTRRFVSSRPGKLVLPATLGPRALDKLRQRGFLRVTVTTKFTPAGSKTAQVYKEIVRLRPFAVTAYAASMDEGVVTATVRTPRAGQLAVNFLLRDRDSGESTTLKSFAVRDLAAGNHVYSSPLPAAARRAISSGQVRLMIKARLDTNLYSARMLRSRYIRISN
jgi:hypothetical protein